MRQNLNLAALYIAANILSEGAFNPTLSLIYLNEHGYFSPDICLAARKLADINVAW
jgi:hypothetical protein